MYQTLISLFIFEVKRFMMEVFESINFYTLDKAIRTYRMYSQKQLKANGCKISVDQWLIVKCVLENSGISQQEIAAKVFKDNASVTRIIELLVKSNYLERSIHPKDRRKSHLKVTASGKLIIEKVYELVLQNRRTALQGIAQNDLEILNATLKKIIENCSS